MLCRKGFKIRDDVTVVGDSGGFQAVTQGKYINPLALLKWQEANCNIAPILDVPPYSSFGGYTETTNFEKCLAQTVSNAQIMNSNRINKEMLQYGVVQGFKNEEIEAWYKAVNEVGNWDGWALAPKPPAPDVLNKFFALAYRKGIKKIHVFQCTGLDSFMLAVYLNYHYLKADVTMDSVSYLASQKFGRIVHPLTYRMINFGRLSGKTFSMVCDCVFCNHYQQVKDQFEDARHINFYYVMNMHNLYLMVRFVTAINQYVQDEELYEEIIDKFASDPETLRKCIQEFKSLITFQPSSIFDF